MVKFKLEVILESKQNRTYDEEVVHATHVLKQFGNYKVEFVGANKIEEKSNRNNR